MMNTTMSPCIWLCDSVDWWVETVTQSFQSRNIALRVFTTTSLLLAEAAVTARPQLTLLGCTRIDANFSAVVARLVRNHHEVVVLTAVESLSLIRNLFVSGAADVIPRFPDMAMLASIIDSDLGAEQRKGRNRWIQPNV